MREELDKNKKYLNDIKIKIINKPKYSLLEDSFTVKDHRFIYADAILYINSKPLALFEFKSAISNLSKQEIISIYERLHIESSFFVITDGKQSKIYDTIQWTLNNVETIDELWEILEAKLSLKEISDLKNRIIEEVNKEIYTFQKNLNGIKKTFKNNNPLISKFKNIETAIKLFKDGFPISLKYDNDGNFFYITNDLRDFKELENQFFKAIIEDVDDNTNIYRYSTLDSIFKTIDLGTLRLSGIVGMNDISEIGYVDSYLDKKFVPMSTDDHIYSVNKKYIMCSSTLEDELIQWRLYGDDCKGACMVFEVNKGTEIPGLLLRKINYGIKFNGANYHPELEFILRIKNRLKKKLKINFHFKTLSLWRHFFKSYEYEPEKEVRLLLIGNESDEIKGEKYVQGVGSMIEIKWNLTNSHKILAPFIVLKINDKRLRCKLKKIILGAKCPELAINLKQFGLLTKKRNLTNIIIEPSKIINYR